MPQQPRRHLLCFGFARLSFACKLEVVLYVHSCLTEVHFTFTNTSIRLFGKGESQEMKNKYQRPLNLSHINICVMCEVRENFAPISYTWHTTIHHCATLQGCPIICTDYSTVVNRSSFRCWRIEMRLGTRIVGLAIGVENEQLPYINY